MFGYLAGKLCNLFDSLSNRGVVGSAKIDQALNMLQETLLNADVPYKVVQQLTSSLREELQNVSKKSTINFQERLQALLFNKLVALMGGEKTSQQLEKLAFPKGSIILFAGLQGAGKTTSIAKLAVFFKQEEPGLRIATTSLDFVRPAAIEQLEILAKRAEIAFLQPEINKVDKTLAMVEDAMQKKEYDLFFIDTPGRMHVNQELMQQLQNIVAIIRPTHSLLVIDSMTGQESLHVAKAFNQAIDFTFAILTKADSDSRGGVALSLFSEVNKPVAFLGCGEKLKDFERFIPKRIASRILGEGDAISLYEKISREIGEEKLAQSEAASQKFLAGEFNLQDFLEQMEMLSSLGSLGKVFSYFPGFTKVSQEQINQVEKIIKNLRAAILSMTPKERLYPAILNRARVKRVAKGAGLVENDVVLLLNKFEESKQVAKLMGKRK